MFAEANTTVIEYSAENILDWGWMWFLADPYISCRALHPEFQSWCVICN